MKKCPQCQSFYDEDHSFCLNDGTPLISPQAETVQYNLPPTIQQNNPAFVVDLLPKQPEVPTQITPIPPVNQTQIPKKTSGFAVPLLIGLLLGGALVIATFFVMKSLDEKETASVVNSNNSNSGKNENTANTSNENTANSEKKESSTNKSENLANTANIVSNTETNTKKDRKYNGRVIMLNAYMRSAPDAYADEVDILPLDDRIVIGKRQSPNSPWYRVTCEHGSTGWMHGNTIEFTR